MIHVVGDSHVMLFTGQKLPWLLVVPEDLKPRGYDLHPGIVTYFVALLRAYWIMHNGLFWQILGSLPKGSTVILVVGEIDCRGPILNVAHRTGRTIEDVTRECVDRYLVGVRKVREMGLNPIIFAPYAQMDLTEIKHKWVLLPEYLTPQEWGEQKKKAVFAFELNLRQSKFPVISLNSWMFVDHIHESTEYWADAIHLSERVWPIIQERLENAEIFP